MISLFNSSLILIASALVALPNSFSEYLSFHLSDLYADIKLLEAFTIPPIPSLNPNAMSSAFPPCAPYPGIKNMF